jgi:hypothetical protein
MHGRNAEMNATDPVRRVSVVSTGQVQIRPDHEASSWRPMAWWLLASRRTAMINALRQQHPGLVILPAHDPGAAGRLAQATGTPMLAGG